MTKYLTSVLMTRSNGFFVHLLILNSRLLPQTGKFQVYFVFDPRINIPFNARFAIYVLIEGFPQCKNLFLHMTDSVRIFKWMHNFFWTSSCAGLSFMVSISCVCEFNILRQDKLYQYIVDKSILQYEYFKSLFDDEEICMASNN